uniref:Protoheme IX farnesyltransferase 2 n=1 Tax=Zeugodacus cucurbitae TaxID=28588 RepID=A0A0A1WG40_ZEUCU
MLSKVIVAIFVVTAILQQATAANLPEPQDTPNAQEAQDAPNTRAAEEPPNSFEARADEIVERALNFLNVKNWNEKAIDNRYSAEDATALAYALNEIYTGTAASFKKMVKLQLYLFKKFEEAGDVNDKYLFNVAYYFLKIKQNQHYASLSNALKRELNDYISYLPPSLDHLFFQTKFCLMNREHLNYMYATDTPIDRQRDYIFVFKNANVNNNKRAWTTKVTDVSTSRQTKLKFALKHNQSKRVAYLERSNYKGKSNMVAAWHSSFQQPSNGEWNVALHQNQLIFSQNGRLICADGSIYDRNHLYVLGQGGNGNGKDAPECQWYAKECP